jgi:hypothetical protein
MNLKVITQSVETQVEISSPPQEIQHSSSTTPKSTAHGGFGKTKI